MRVPPKRQVNIKLLAEQSYETLAVLAAVFPQNQNAFGTAKNYWSRSERRERLAMVPRPVVMPVCRVVDE
jgi:hypothetical protein